MIYQGIGISNNFSNGRKSVEIQISEDEILFSFDEEKIIFKSNKTEITIGGASNRLIYFKHVDFPEFTFYTSDKKILKDPKLIAHEHAIEGLKKTKKHVAVNSSIWIGLFLFIALILGSVFFFRNKMVKSVADKLPPSWEKEVGDKLFTQVELEYKLVKDSLLIDELTKILQPLIKSIDDTAFKFKFYIANNPTLNAFAMPGGNVVIHSGIIESADSWEELMGVLAHELAHVTQRHHVRGIISNIGIYAVLSTFIGDASAILGTLSQAGGSLTSLKTSREYENESDEIGWDYLLKANINPVGMIGMFKKLQKEYPENKETEKFTSLLSSHPAIGERILHLEKKNSELKNKNFITFKNSFNTFKNRLKTDLQNN